MTPERFAECLATIGWTSTEFARRADIHETRARKYASGRWEIPGEISRWLEKVAAFHERTPAPECNVYMRNHG